MGFKEIDNDEIRTAVATLFGGSDIDKLSLTRSQKKALEYSVRKAGAQLKKAKFLQPPVVDLAARDEILENEDDLRLYEKQIPLYELAQRNGRNVLRYYNIAHSFGMPEDMMRIMILGIKIEDLKNLDLLPPQKSVDPRTMQKMQAVVKNTFGSKPPKFTIVDEDDFALKTVLADAGIPVKDILEESLRARQETIDLMKMQATWLQEHPAQPENDMESPYDELPVSGDAPALPINLPQTSVEPYLLSQWDLYWTKVPWSKEPNHLVPISTTSKVETLRELIGVGRQHISVKPASIVRLFEFHLQKEPLQRAMAARLKYVSDETKEWAKLKRGSDRIPLLVPEEGKAIFFVCGRDEIYRHLDRK